MHVELPRAAKVFEFDKEATFTAYSEDEIDALKAQVEAAGRISIDSIEDCPVLSYTASNAAIDEACNNFIEE